MSMLRSAAMTLLSKTLLTFLYKYLSDVDVEGIEMPSLYGSSDGSSSGWGVRLSNVKLREGAELMQLPGGRKNKNKKSNPKKSQKKNESEKKSNESNGANYESEISEHPTNGTDKADGERLKFGNEINHTPTHELAGHELANTDQDERTLKAPSKRDPTPEHDTKARSRSYSADTEYTEGLDYDGENESLGSLDEGTRPETPVQESSFSFLSCFAPGTDPKNRGGKKAEQKAQQGHAATSQVEENHDDTENSEQRSYPQEHFLNGDDPREKLDEISQHNQSESVAQWDEQKRAALSAEQVHATTRSTVAHQEEKEWDKEECNSDKHNIEDVDENDAVDDESTPMVLRIGEGGSIGTLDVRLVGGELHVFVEDAYLTLEAVTKGSTADEEAAAKAEQQSTTAGTKLEEATAAEKKQSATAAAAAAPKTTQEKELKTTGERVLAANAIARLFSSIPHLFLRDIRVRLVVRDDSDSSNDRDESNEDESENATWEDAELHNADAVVDIGIELLSVTEGDDFLSPFNIDEASMQGDQESLRRMSSQMSTRSDSSPDNVYLERRIRTGKGSDGGIWINVVTPKLDQSPSLKRYNSIPAGDVQQPQHSPWARNAWLESTRYCIFRCAGLDVYARIFLGTRKELAHANSSYLWAFDDTESYQGIDHTLYGFDHVVPGPTPHTLPPLAPHGPIGSASRSIDEEDEKGFLFSQVYKTDSNGIQSSKIQSNFYRVGRGMTPTRCMVEHLPCENCCKCWEVSSKRTANNEAIPENHPLDASTPMPGLALSISIRDPLEINADRLSLDGLGLVIDLFKKKKNEDESSLDQDDERAPKSCPEEQEERQGTVEVSPQEGKEILKKSTFSSYFFGRKSPAQTNDSSLAGLISRRSSKEEEPPAFPAYMKPEAIQILGIYIAKVNVRLQVMREDDEKRHNSGLSFCYWDTKAECLTLDQQQLKAQERVFQDMKLDMGIFEVTEFKGTDSVSLIRSGVPFPNGDADLVSLGSLRLHRNNKSRSPWPTTACALLDVTPALESLAYESRERHGVQLRYLQVIDKPETPKEKIRTLVNCQVGPADINLSWPIKQTILDIKDEAMKSLLGIAKEGVTDPEAVDENQDKLMQYRVQLGGGRVRLKPLIDIKLPLTRLAGDICPKTGFSIETLFDHVDLCYGQSSHKMIPTATSAKGFSLKKVLSLPERVRLRILLFVDDLDPLEKAFDVKRQSSPFLRCNALNKALTQAFVRKAAQNQKKSHKKKAEADSKKKLNRRQELLNKILTLDDEALESLWATHHKKQKKAKKHAGKKS